MRPGHDFQFAQRSRSVPEAIVDAGAVAVLDGRDGVGQVIASRTAHDAIRRAKAHGIGAVAVRNSNHFGTAAYFTRLATLEGCIGLLTTNASPAMAPWGGGRRPWATTPGRWRRRPGLILPWCWISPTPSWPGERSFWPGRNTCRSLPSGRSTRPGSFPPVIGSVTE